MADRFAERAEILKSSQKEEVAQPSDRFAERARLIEESEPSRPRSLMDALSKGLIRGAKNINPIPTNGPIPPQLRERLLQHFLPSQERGVEAVLEKAGELAPIVALGPESVAAKALQLGGGTLAGSLAKEAGMGPIGQGVSEIVGMGLPGAIKSGVEKTVGLIKAPKETLPSGLTKPTAIEAKYPEKAIISPIRQEKAISSLEKEAGELTKKTVEARLPIVKKIESGFDFAKDFEKKFGHIKEVAGKVNPEVDITPVSDLLNETRAKYRGIPKLHEDAVKVEKEIKAFKKNPQQELDNLLKIYRSNVKKMNSIYETAHTTGKQKEYVDFLADMNQAIASSFDKSFPQGTAMGNWARDFRRSNAEYRDYKRGLDTLGTLEGVLQRKLTPESLNKVATNKKTFQHLEMSMGKEGAAEVKQIAEDLEKAVESLKAIPAKKMDSFDAVAPLYYFVPVIGKVLTLKKGTDFVRRAYGYYLSTPAKRAQYDSVLKAIAKRDLEAYSKAAMILLGNEQEVSNPTGNLQQ